MNENKRLIMIFVVIVAVLAIILLISFWPAKDKTFSCGVKADGDYEKLGKINYKQYQCLYDSGEKNAIVVSSDMIDAKKSAINDAAKKVGHAVYYLDNEKISSEDLDKIKKELKYNDASFEKDVVIVINDKKVSGFKEDNLTKTEDLYNFFKESKLAKFSCDVASDKEYENLGAITYDQYKCLYDSEEPFALVLAQTTCSYCVSYKPIIDDYAAKNNLPVYIVEIDQLSDDERSALLSSLSYFKDNESWGTPLTLGIKNKEVISDISGYTDDESSIDNFFSKLGLK